MAPPRKQPKTEEERKRLEDQREKSRRRYQRKRLAILAENKLTHEKNKDRYNKQKAEKQKEIRAQVKIAKNKYVTVEEVITPTIEAIGGHFSGDGCVMSKNGGLCVYSLDLDTLKAYEGVLGGGTTKKQGKGYLWRTKNSETPGIIALLTPYAWTKQEQLLVATNGGNEDELKRLKTVNPSYTVLPDGMEKVIAGFFTADGHCTNRHANLRSYVVFGQHHRAILETIKSFYPGGSEISPYTPTANGSKVDKNGEYYTSFQLTYSGDAALGLLKSIYPWIIAERVKKSVQRCIKLHEKNANE